MLLPKIYPVTCNTNHVSNGSTFVAIEGFQSDGSTFITEALRNGASRIVITAQQHTPDVAQQCIQYGASLLIVENTRIALAELAAESLDFPAKKLSIIGITGTKGKSTTTMLIAHLLEAAGKKVALLNTIYNSILSDREQSSLTTPGGDYLQMFFAACVNRGVTHVIMEVSAHALSLHRTHGIIFSAVGFTNLAPEHLDFYTTMESYFAAKASIFTQTDEHSLIVINADNEWAPQAVASASNACKTTGTKLQTFGTKKNSSRQHAHVNIMAASTNGISLQIDSAPVMACPQLFGNFNCYNIAMAACITKHLGIDDLAIAQGLKTFSGVPGRLQRHVLRNGALAFVDYAHNPSSMHEVLKTLRPFTSHLIVVFGCGGDRDTTKRPVMGSLAAEYADHIIVTSDNPRTEDPASIIEQIRAGIPVEKQNVTTIMQDRRKAIAHAAQIAPTGSIIALLGKGHENYYLAGTHKSHLDDLEEIQLF